MGKKPKAAGSKKKQPATPASIRRVEASLKTLPKRENPLLPTLWVDASALSLREDGNALLRFYAFQPTVATEECRAMTSTDHLRALVDMLTRNLDYYPEKPVPVDANSD